MGQDSELEDWRWCIRAESKDFLRVLEFETPTPATSIDNPEQRRIRVSHRNSAPLYESNMGARLANQVIEEKDVGKVPREQGRRT